jgi:predicted dehydrogenase
LQKLKNSEFVSVWSRTPSSAERFADLYKVKPYESIQQMVKDQHLDLVVICTPHPFHKDPTNEALKAGSHVLVEKPLAASLQDCDSMINTAKKYKKKLGVISQRRWYAPVIRVKRALEEGKIGKPVMGTINMLGWRDEAYYNADPWRGTWKDEGGGVLVNQAPHQLDILLWYMGEIDELFGVWSNLNHPYIEVEDTALAIIRFRNGALGNIIVSNSEKPGIYGKVHVHGENGASVGVQTDGGAMFVAGMSNVLEPPVNDLWTVPGEEEKLKAWVEEDSVFFNTIDPTVYYMERQIEDFLEALKDDREPMVNGLDGRRTVEPFTAIYRSQRDNKVIKFPLNTEADHEDFDGRL